MCTGVTGRHRGRGQGGQGQKGESEIMRPGSTCGVSANFKHRVIIGISTGYQTLREGYQGRGGGGGASKGGREMGRGKYG